MSDADEIAREDATFAKASGKHYLNFFEEMHETLRPDWYLEIGTQTGASLAKSKSKSVSVDPQFVLKQDVWANKPELHLFQTTSDEFFAAGHLERLGCTVDLAFLDGMHLYEYLLRDFLNTEPKMSPDGCIVLHDCLPWSVNMALRDRRQVQQRAWTGDVWKLVPILQKYRPDLTLRVFDAAPTGLVVVTGLDPSSTVLSDNYDEIIKEFDANDDLPGYIAGLKVESTQDSPWAVRPRRPDGPLHFALKTNVPRPRFQTRWGDYHFAIGLQNALSRLGHTATVRTRKHWGVKEKDHEIDLVISGHTPHPKRLGHLTLQWLISSASLSEADHTFVAGAPMLNRLQGENPQAEMSLLPQAFDTERMPMPDPDQARSGVLFVGIARDGKRPLVDFALKTKTDLDIWGPGWRDTAARDHVRGEHLDNAQLGQHYCSAEVVLNDHTPLMREHGLTSNRIFDALACAAPVISDDVAWLPDDLRPFVEVVSTADEFEKALARIRSETAKKREARYDFAIEMRKKHSFDTRAKEVLRVVEKELG